MANPYLQPYIKLTEFLGLALGPDYEIALHDLTDKNHSIIAIANSQISGRTVGAPLTNVALQVLMDKSYERQDYRLHYQGLSASGTTLRSCTYYIKQDQKLIGMLCINFDDSRYRAAVDNFLHLCHPQAFLDGELAPGAGAAGPPKAPQSTTESFHNSIGAVAGDAVEQKLERMGLQAEIISNLEQEGIFLLKGAVKDVAAALHCSQASVYRYLAQIKKEN